MPREVCGKMYYVINLEEDMDRKLGRPLLVILVFGEASCSLVSRRTT